MASEDCPVPAADWRNLPTELAQDLSKRGLIATGDCPQAEDYRLLNRRRHYHALVLNHSAKSLARAAGHWKRADALAQLKEPGSPSVSEQACPISPRDWKDETAKLTDFRQLRRLHKSDSSAEDGCKETKDDLFAAVAAAVAQQTSVPWKSMCVPTFGSHAGVQECSAFKRQ